jgi:hypothetical protein
MQRQQQTWHPSLAWRKSQCDQVRFIRDSAITASSNGVVTDAGFFSQHNQMIAA